MKCDELIILVTTPVSIEEFMASDTVDKSDHARLKKNPKLKLNKDWQSSRFLKKQVHKQNNNTLSLSHRKGHAALLSSTISSLLIGGIDIEYMQKRDFLSLSELFCSTEEQLWLSKQKNLTHAFYLLWTLKESLIKVHQASLADMKKFSLINPEDTKDELTIPAINNVILKGLSFKPTDDWIISAVYGDLVPAKAALSLQGFGQWQSIQLTDKNLQHFQANNA